MSSQSKNKPEQKGFKHLIQCHCILPQYRNSADPVFHQFVVFSIIDLKSDTVIPKFSECNNCGAAHKIVDLCKSEIIVGKDEVSSQLSITDLKYVLPESLYELLGAYEKDLPDYEHAQFILENQMWGDHILLTREEIDDHIQGKLVKFLERDKFRVESYTTRRTI